MSPARTLSLEDIPRHEVSFGGLWSAKGPRRQRRHEKRRVDELSLVDDLKTLWETRWKSACKRQSHPFQDASYLEVATVMTSLLQRGITSARAPAYTEAFLSLAESHARDARAALLSPGNAERASNLLLRACALARVARFPGPSSGPSSPARDEAVDGGGGGDGDDDDLRKKEAYELQRSYYVEAAGLSGLSSPLDEVLIPHIHDAATHPDAAAGMRAGGGVRQRRDEVKPAVRRPQIPAFVRVPLETLLTGRQCPAAVILTRDRTGNTRACEDVLDRGWACVVVEVPAAGGRQGREAEAEAEEEKEQERVWRSVLDWMGGMFFFDMDKVVVMAQGDAAVRMASGAHGERIRGVVAYESDEQHHQHADSVQGGLFADKSVPLCRTLVVSGCVRRTDQSDGLWTPPLEGEEQAAAASLALCAYGPGSAACVGRLETADMGRVYVWMEAVVHSRASEIEREGSVHLHLLDSLAFVEEPARPKGKGMATMMPQWFAMDLTPPTSDVEVASSLGSLY